MPDLDHLDPALDHARAMESARKLQAEHDYLGARAALERGSLVAWAALSRGVPERLIREGHAEQDGVMYLRKNSPGMVPGQTPKGSSTKGTLRLPEGDERVAPGGGEAGELAGGTPSGSLGEPVPARVLDGGGS